MTSTNLEKTIQIISDVLGLSPETLGTGSGPTTVEAWESINHLSIVLALEEAFSVSFEPEEVARMTTVQAILDLLREKGVDG